MEEYNMNIHHNLQRPYWVVEIGKITHYGILEEGQETTSIHQIKTFSSEEDWLKFLNDKGITIEITEENGQ
jgi:hypothetical protein